MSDRVALTLTIAGFPEWVWRSFEMGALRWLIGLALGVLIFLLVRPALLVDDAEVARLGLTARRAARQ